MTVEIRLATKEDAALISALNTDVQAIHSAVHPDIFKQPDADTFPAKEIEEVLSEPDSFIYLALNDGAPAGYLIGEVFHHEGSSRHHPHAMIYVHQISVKPELRKLGIGTKLLHAAEDMGRSLGINRLALDTWTFNENARAFFRGYGLSPYNEKMWKLID